MGKTIRNQELRNINRLFSLVNKSIFTINNTLDYTRITEAIIQLANNVYNYSGENEDIWYIGEYGECCLSDFIVGAYWHYTEWHEGQSSDTYKALCALGSIFSPNMSTLDEENRGEYFTYQQLESIAS